MYSWWILRQWCKGHSLFFHSFILFKLRLSLRYCFSISIGFLFRCHCVCLKLKISHMRIFCSCFTFNNKDIRTIDLLVPRKITFSIFSFLQLRHWRKHSVIKDCPVYWHLFNKKYTKISLIFSEATLFV